MSSKSITFLNSGAKLRKVKRITKEHRSFFCQDSAFSSFYHAFHLPFPFILILSTSARTASPLPADSESARRGLPFSINGTDGCHTNAFRNDPPVVPFLPGMPMYKGLSHGRVTRFSLPSPSRFQSQGSHGRARPQKREGDGSDIHLPSRASNALYIGL